MQKPNKVKSVKVAEYKVQQQTELELDMEYRKTCADMFKVIIKQTIKNLKDNASK
jgi:hypothetical protein